MKSPRHVTSRHAQKDLESIIGNRAESLALMVAGLDVQSSSCLIFRTSSLLATDRSQSLAIVFEVFTI